MHIDLNSCFATVEQQANPFLRGKPIAVAAYNSPGGCIVAPSIEAKKIGIKVGMRVRDGKLICSDLIVLTPDPAKYRSVHLALQKILSDYTNELYPKSIDEFVLNLEGYPCLGKRKKVFFPTSSRAERGDLISKTDCHVASAPRNDNLDAKSSAMQSVAKEIKQRIKKEIGEWITVSIGIAPSRFLAKLASNLHKPDGLDEINSNNFLDIYSSLKLTDLCGIDIRNTARLNSVGIYSVIDFYNAELWKLKAAFKSVAGYYWYSRLRGYEIDNVEFGRRSFGNSYALPKPLIYSEELSPILSKLVTKMGARLRRAGFVARGVCVSVSYRDGTRWRRAVSFQKTFFDSRDIYKKAFKILSKSPCKKPVRKLAVSCFNLFVSSKTQLDLFDDVVKKQKLVNAVDDINNRWGDFVITPAKMLLTDSASVPDRIAFGGVRELEG